MNTGAWAASEHGVEFWEEQGSQALEASDWGGWKS